MFPESMLENPYVFTEQSHIDLNNSLEKNNDLLLKKEVIWFLQWPDYKIIKKL